MNKSDRPMVEHICLPSMGGCGQKFMVSQGMRQDLCNNCLFKIVQGLRSRSNEVSSPIDSPPGSGYSPEKVKMWDSIPA
ncbi:MAG: hypothetical protein WC749_17245 [Dehalococcoidia bacterium]